MKSGKKRHRRLAPLVSMLTLSMLAIMISWGARGGFAAAPRGPLPRTRAAVNRLWPPTPISVGPHVPRVLRDELMPARATGQVNGPPGNFPFESASSTDGLIVVYFYGRPASYAQSFLAEVQQAIAQRVAPALGYGLKSRVIFYTYNSRADFLAGAQPFQPQITGAYSTADSAIFLPDAGDQVTFDVIAHELSHVVLIQHTDVGHLETDYYLYPRWLDEGLAESVIADNGDSAAYDDTILAQALAQGQFLDIFSRFVWTYPADLATDDLCYAEARAFIKYLTSTYGTTKFYAFIAALADGNLTFAAETGFGVDVQTLQSGWNASLGLPVAPHPSGSAPKRAPAIPFSPGQITGVTQQTTPYMPAGGAVLLKTTGIQAGIAIGIVLLGLLLSALLARRRRRKGSRASSARSAPMPLAPRTAAPRTAAPRTAAPRTAAPR
nr:hypothetical protein [Ktedonobacterales bacterium]